MTFAVLNDCTALFRCEEPYPSTTGDTLASVLRAKQMRRAKTKTKQKQKQNKIYERNTQELDKWVRGGARVFLHGF